MLAPLIAGLAMLGPFSIDTFFPAFRVIEAEFGITAVSMQQTVSVYLIAFMAMSLLHGPLSDAYGRRGVILVSLVLFAAASAGCALAPSLPMLLLFRALQGISAGAGMIVGRAIVRDRFDGADAQRLMSQVTLIFGVAPAIAPIIGGFVLSIAGWRPIFWMLTCFTMLLGLASLGALPETLPRPRRVPLSVRQLAHTYGAIVRDHHFVLLALAASMNFGALFTYIASAPTIVLDLLHLNVQQFGWLFIPVIGGMMLGAGLSGRLAGRRPPLTTVRWGYLLMGSGAAINLLVSALLPPSAPWSILPVTVSAIGVSLSFPTLTILMLDRFPAVRGAAASVQAAVALGFNAVVSGMISPLLSHSLPLLALGTSLTWGCSFLLWLLYCRLAPEVRPQVLLETPSGVTIPNAPTPEN
ncbi:MAG: Major facilitator superfamily transrane protein [Nevskia sp.]|nr:Major facilitator superfamily transrane protein [Nevskia sp.]